MSGGPLEWVLSLMGKHVLGKVLDSMGKSLSRKLQKEFNEWAAKVEVKYPDLPADNLANFFFVEDRDGSAVASEKNSDS